MAPFLVSLIFDLSMAALLLVAVARVLRSHTSPALLSYLFFLVFWYALVLYMLIFLSAPRFLPEGAQRAYMLFNSIFIVPLNGLIAFFFIDFVWRWLEKPMPRLLRFGLPVPFLVILVAYATEMLGKLSAEAPSQSFALSAPASLILMFACVLLALLYAAIAGRGLKDREKGKYVLLFTAVTGGGLAVGVLFVFGAFSFLGTGWQNAAASMILASINVAAWASTRRFFQSRARAAADQIAQVDLSMLETRYNISPREREVISLVITGKSNREITEELFISPDTVKKHVYNAYRKIGVRNRVQLVNAVLELVSSASHHSSPTKTDSRGDEGG